MPTRTNALVSISKGTRRKQEERYLCVAVENADARAEQSLSVNDVSRDNCISFHIAGLVLLKG